jgi:hypothetical protein
MKRVRLDGSNKVGGITDAMVFPYCADFAPMPYCDGLAKVREGYSCM